MELKVIRHQNNEMTTTSYYLKKEQEILIARVYIDNEVSRRLSDVVSDKQPFTILCENGYSGFVSEHVQVVRTKDIIDITYEGGHVQYIFSNTCETTTLSLAA